VLAIPPGSFEFIGQISQPFSSVFLSQQISETLSTMAYQPSEQDGRACTG
jgi:hypothetical protein